MRRITTLLALVAACGLGISAAQACPKSCNKKASAQKTKVAKCVAPAKQACTASDEFPTLIQLVGDKKVGCPIEAEKLAKDSGDKIIYVVGSKKFESRRAAVTAWAEASESYAKRFLTIACVVDGKALYCDKAHSDASACSSAKAKLSKADSKATCKASAAKLAKADGKKCPLKAAKLAKTDGKECAKKCPLKAAKLAKTDGKECAKKCPLEAAKLAKTGGKECAKKCPLEAAKLAKTDGKECAKKCPLEAAKLAKTDGKECVKKCPLEAAKLAKVDDKSAAKKCPLEAAKLAKAKGCSKASKASLARAHCESFVAQGKTVKYRVVGRDFDTWADAVKARDQASAAAKKVSMKYIVDGKEVACASQVCPKAKAAGKVVYVVSGEKMECQYRARAALAKAQCKAAKEACTKLLAKM